MITVRQWHAVHLRVAEYGHDFAAYGVQMCHVVFVQQVLAPYRDLQGIVGAVPGQAGVEQVEWGLDGIGFEFAALVVGVAVANIGRQPVFSGANGSVAVLIIPVLNLM